MSKKIVVLLQSTRTSMESSTSTILNKKYKKLILQISIHEVSFCLYNTLESKIDLLNDFRLPKNNTFKETEHAIIQLIKDSTILRTGFDEVLVLHNNSLHTFVPQSLFDENALLSYLQYNVQVYPNDYATYDEINSNELNNIYIPFVAINNALIDVYGNFNFKHANTILAKKILEFSKNHTEAQLFLNVQDNSFQLVATKNQKLLLFNTFEYHTEEDFIYHLLFAIEQLKFNPENIQVKLLGAITREHPLFEITYKYIRNVSLFQNEGQKVENVSQENYLKHFTLIHACE